MEFLSITRGGYIYLPRITSTEIDVRECLHSKVKTDLIAQYFASRAEDVFDEADLENLFTERFHEWNLPTSMMPYTFWKAKILSS